MGTRTSKIKISDVNQSYEDDKIEVNFVQLKKKQNCNVTPERLNILFGINIPKYSFNGDLFYPYLFCVSKFININKIIFECGYDGCIPFEKKVFKREFNDYYKTKYESVDGYDYYELVLI